MHYNNIITLTTDFGNQDGYVGAMKGVILSICPDADIVDITHGVARQSIVAGAIVLRQTAPFYPKGTIHVGVIDPGVGTERRSIVATAGGHWFVGPDNGLFLPVLRDLAGEAGYTCWEITDEEVTLPARSATFHGRDIFAPAAAHLARGVSGEAMGRQLNTPEPLNIPTTRSEGQLIHGDIIYEDHFGNLITNISGELLSGASGARLVFPDRGSAPDISELVTTYEHGSPGEPLLLVGSSGYVEIAINRGSAADHLGVGPGESVAIKLAQEST